MTTLVSMLLTKTFLVPDPCFATIVGFLSQLVFHLIGTFEDQSLLKNIGTIKDLTSLSKRDNNKSLKRTSCRQQELN